MRVRRIKVIVNPGAGAGRALERVAKALVPPPGVELEWVQSRSAQHLGELMRAAQREELHAIGLAGGDGTVHHALAGLDDAPNPVPIGLLPVGSGNDFAVACGVPRDVGAALDVLVRGTPKPVDLGACADGRRFCCVAGVGLDELALRIIYASWLPRSKALNVIAALRALAVYRPRRVRIAWEGGTFDGEIMFAAVTNTRSYGGGFLVTPGASVNDAALNLCIVRRTGRLRLLGSFPRILEGTHVELDEVLLATSPWVRIESDEPLPVPLDGELQLAQTPLHVTCEPGALAVMQPGHTEVVRHPEVARVA